SHTLDVSLPAQPAVAADFPSDSSYFGGEGSELVHHRVDGVLEFQDFALHVDGNLFRQVARRHRLGDVGDVAHLAGKVAGHEVDAIGQVLPRSGHALDLGLAAQLAFGADLAGDARYFRSERAELIYHGIDGVLQLENLALNGHGTLLASIAGADRRRHFGDVANLSRKIAGHQIDAVREVLPGAGHPLDVRLAAQPALGADLASHARDFRGKRAELI